VNELAATIRRAFDIARSGRPGPVLWTSQGPLLRVGELEPLPVPPRRRGIAAPSKGASRASDGQIAEAAGLISASERPKFCRRGRHSLRGERRLGELAELVTLPWP
jgi:thiamine pyrophosphate-dependent acetolactate synthase large subunit-like protein